MEGGSSGLWLNIFAFVPLAEIDFKTANMHRNDLFLHSLTHFLCQACSWALFRNESFLLVSCLLVRFQKVLVFPQARSRFRQCLKPVFPLV